MILDAMNMRVNVSGVEFDFIHENTVDRACEIVIRRVCSTFTFFLNFTAGCVTDELFCVAE